MALYLVSYDITPDGRRTKIARLLEGYGSRVQRSVFECDLTAQQYTQLRRRLAKLLRADDGDNVRIYQLCAGCVRTIEIIGTGKIEHTPAMYIV
jgi:CRISPR-associated protein Cas2